MGTPCNLKATGDAKRFAKRPAPRKCPPGYRFLAQFVEDVPEEEVRRLHPYLLGRPGVLLMRGSRRAVWSDRGWPLIVGWEWVEAGWSAYIPVFVPTGEL